MTEPTTDRKNSYSLIFEDRPGYLYAHLKAEKISAAIIAAYVDEMVAESDAVGKRRILLVRDIPEALSEGDVFHTVQDSLEKLRGKKLAFVNPHAAIQAELEFGMTVGRNRGGEYAVFSDEKSAEAWLLSS